MEALIILAGLAICSLIMTFVKAPAWGREYRAWQQWRPLYRAGTLPSIPSVYEQGGGQTPPPAAPHTAPTTATAKPLPGAAWALAEPPQSLQATLDQLARPDRNRPYSFPIGWIVNDKHQASLTTAALVDDVNHIAVTGQSDVGKDNLVLNILLSLALRHTPEQLQIAVMDGKGLDFVAWENKAHTWGLANTPDEIGPMMIRLTNEMNQRRGILTAARVSKWTPEKPHGLPMLVCYISELSLLENAVGANDLAKWLNRMFTAGRAFGMRFIIAAQSLANFDTQFRSQIGLYMAGYQPTQAANTPNTGLSLKELTSRESVPPSALPSPPKGKGVFTAVQGADRQTVRCSFLSDEERNMWLDRLPNAPRPVETVNPFADEQAMNTSPVHRVHSAPVSAVPAHSDAQERTIEGVHGVHNEHKQERRFEREIAPEPDHALNAERAEQLTLSTPPALDTAAGVVYVPDDERRQILALAATGMPRRDIAKAVYGGNGKYDRVKAVLNDQSIVEQLGGVVTGVARQVTPSS